MIKDCPKRTHSSTQPKNPENSTAKEAIDVLMTEETEIVSEETTGEEATIEKEAAMTEIEVTRATIVETGEKEAVTEETDAMTAKEGMIVEIRGDQAVEVRVRTRKAASPEAIVPTADDPSLTIMTKLLRPIRITSQNCPPSPPPRWQCLRSGTSGRPSQEHPAAGHLLSSPLPKNLGTQKPPRHTRS